MNTYNDDDLVYVDPDEKKVIGLVEWDKMGNPKSLPVPQTEETAGDPHKRKRRRRNHFPWGTYRSMKKIYRLEGKEIDKKEGGKTLDEVLTQPLEKTF